MRFFQQIPGDGRKMPQTFFSPKIPATFGRRICASGQDGERPKTLTNSVSSKILRENQTSVKQRPEAPLLWRRQTNVFLLRIPRRLQWQDQSVNASARRPRGEEDLRFSF